LLKEQDCLDYKLVRDFWDQNVSNSGMVTGTSLGLVVSGLDTVGFKSSLKGRVLEIGPGMGKMVGWFKQYSHIDFHVYDISQKVLDKINLPEEKKHLEFPKGFNLIFCHLVFQHCDKQMLGSLFRQVYEALVDEGKFIFQYREGPKISYSLEKQLMTGTIYHTEEEIRNYLVKFKNIKISKLNQYNWKYVSATKQLLGC
jgi:SAM-dependent methyltransferase